MKILRSLLIVLSLAVPCSGMAQEEEHYTKEIGIALGGNFMLNDVNSTPYGDTRFSGGLLLRFLLNPRMAVKVGASYNNIKGETSGVADFYPADPSTSGNERLEKAFSGGITDLSATYELNFLPYGYHAGYQGYKRITPFIQFGLGLTYSDAGKAFTMNIPLGFGLKWKVGPRVNMAIDWTMHLTPSDKLDDIKGPKGIGSKMFRNADHYGRTMLTLTYDFSKRCPACQRAER
ncbi:MAG: DUF6089 family protein [Alloprevotella sp.]